MRISIIFLTALMMFGISGSALAQWTTTGPFSIINTNNVDGAFPTNYMNVAGNSQLSIGANWVSGYSDLSLINSNLSNMSGGGFSLWQLTGSNTKKMLAYFQGNGNVGFGGIIPTRALEVRGVNPIFRIGTLAAQNAQVNTVIGGIEFPTSGDNLWMAKINANVGAYSDQPYLTFHTGGASAEQMRISQSGNVGIGSVDPVSKLHIKGGGLTLGSNAMSVNTDGYLSLGDYNANSSPTGQNWTAQTSLLLSALDYSTIGFHDSGSRVDFIRSGGGKIDLGYDGGWGRAHVGFANGIWDANGKVGIGTLTPTALLHVNGNYRSEGSFSQGWPGTFAIDATGVIGGRFVILDNGNVGIGTPAPGNYKLAVEGKIGAREVEVKTGSWADFVFDKEYELPSLKEVESHIKAEHHLLGIPSEVEVKEKGYALGAMDAKLLQKIEELTLYVIQQQKEINQLKRLIKPVKGVK